MIWLFSSWIRALWKILFNFIWLLALMAWSIFLELVGLCSYFDSVGVDIEIWAIDCFVSLLPLLCFAVHLCLRPLKCVVVRISLADKVVFFHLWAFLFFGLFLLNIDPLIEKLAEILLETLFLRTSHHLSQLTSLLGVTFWRIRWKLFNKIGNSLLILSDIGVDLGAMWLKLFYFLE